MDEWSQLRQRRWSGSNARDAVFAQLAAVSSEPSSVAQDIGFPPWQAAFIQAGLENSNFKDTPPDISSDINNITNKLPGWFFTQSSGTAITARVIADAASGSGYVVRFTVAAGAAGDEAYLERVVQFSSGRGRTFMALPGVHHLGSSGVSNLVRFCNAQYLRSDGSTTTGTSAESTATFSAAESDRIALPNGGMEPSDAGYLRIRFGVRRGTAANSQTGTQDFTETWITTAGASVPIGEYSDPATYTPGQIDQQNGNLAIYPNFWGSSTVGLGLQASTTLFTVVGSQTSIQTSLDVQSISTPTISSNKNDYSPSGLSTATILFLYADGAYNITGLDGGRDGRVLVLINDSAFTLTLTHADAASVAANRFHCPGAVNFSLSQNRGVTLVWGGDSRWHFAGTA